MVYVLVMMVASLLTWIMMVAAHGSTMALEDQGSTMIAPEVCSSAQALVAFVASAAAGQRRLCLNATDMSTDLGSIKVQGHQNISVVSGGGSQLSADPGHQHRLPPIAMPPRFFGRFILDDNSGAELLLHSTSIRDRNATQDFPGCGGPSADVYCLGAAVWVGSPTKLTATHTTFQSLSARDGGAIYIRGGTVLLKRVAFTDVHSVYSGGAIFAAMLPQPLTCASLPFRYTSLPLRPRRLLGASMILTRYWCPLLCPQDYRVYLSIEYRRCTRWSHSRME